MKNGDKFVIFLTDDVSMECRYVAPHHTAYGVRHDYVVERTNVRGDIEEGQEVTVQMADLDAWDWKPVQLA